MMNKTGSTSQLAPKTSQRTFFQWAVKWFYTPERENLIKTSTKPDIPSIICLLQAIGFKLREFEKREQLISIGNKPENENIRITMECGTSKMVAVLEMDQVKCECPDTNVAKDGSFWSITGTGPMGASIDNINKVEESGSNLLPEVSRELAVVVRDVIDKLFKMINRKGEDDFANSEINIHALHTNGTATKNTEIKEGLVRSYTDICDNNFKPRTVTQITSNLVNMKFGSSKNVVNKVKPQLQRQGTYDVDEDSECIDEPRPSPPKLASSPVLHQLCTSLGQISLQSDEEIYSLADYVVKAHQILDKAITHIIKKLPLSSSQTSIPEESHFVKPTPPPLSNSSFSTNSPLNQNTNKITLSRSSSTLSTSSISRPGSTCSLPSRTVTTGKIPTIEKSLARRNGGTSLLPTIRDRAASFGNQRTASPKTLAFAANVRRKSTTAVGNSPSLQQNQRSNASMSLKLPPSKLSQTRSNLPATTERTLLSVKRRISPDPKSQTSSPATRGNISHIKAPTHTSKVCTTIGTANSSKFGFTGTKK